MVRLQTRALHRSGDRQIENCSLGVIPGEAFIDSFESKAHSFIVKIWLEESEEKSGVTLWRGHVTHVPSGERRYLQRLEDLVTIVAQYLGSAVSETERDRPLRKWLRRWKRS